MCSSMQLPLAKDLLNFIASALHWCHQLPKCLIKEGSALRKPFLPWCMLGGFPFLPSVEKNTSEEQKADGPAAGLNDGSY